MPSVAPILGWSHDTGSDRPRRTCTPADVAKLVATTGKMAREDVTFFVGHRLPPWCKGGGT